MNGLHLQPGAYSGLREMHLFAGAGGGILAGQLIGHRCVCAVEFEPYAQAVLVARQNDGCFPPFPIWDNVQTFDGKPWAGRVDVVCGGFPCQDISAAGKGQGITGKRSGLWGEMARIVSEVRPSYVFVENSPMLTSRGLGAVLGDLAALGFDARWCVLGAGHVGAPHRRERIWILANSQKTRFTARIKSAFESNRQPLDKQSWGGIRGRHKLQKDARRFCTSDYGVANRQHELAALGNGQVPIVAATAWRLLGGE